MITIKNLDRIVGMTSYGLPIFEAYEDWNMQVPVYVFKLEYDNPLLKNNNIPVYLERIDMNGEYDLYVMGFRTITQTKIDKTIFSSGPADLVTVIRSVLKPLFEYISKK
jgi:hypothetical protein